MDEAHREEDEVGFDYFRTACLPHFGTSAVFRRQPFHLFDFDAFQCVLFADETDGGEVPAADASFFVAAARFQHLRVQGPGSCRVMSDGRLGHDFDLRHVSGFVAIGCPDAVASRVAATDDEDFLAFAVDDVFRRDDDAFEDTVLL